MGRRGSPCCSLAEIVTLCTWLGTFCARCPHFWSTDEPHGRGRRWKRNGALVASYQACGIVPCQRVCSLLVSGCSRGLRWIYRAPTCLATWMEILGPRPLCVPLHPDPRVLNLPPQECTMCSPQVSYVSVPASLHAQRPNWEQKGTEAPPCTDVAILALRCLLRSNGYRKHIGKPHPIISTPAATTRANAVERRLFSDQRTGFRT
jgi:hypothetical protein